jgi:tetratricopeptide (TPR) repeat protein
MSKGERGSTGDTPLERIIGKYLEQLDRGYEIDPFRILAEHPEEGPEILAALEDFCDLGKRPSGGEPLGQLGDYTLCRQLGRGGMGVVYEAWERSMDRRVALKVLPAGIAADERAVSRFVREAQLAGRLQHPSIVSVYGMGVKDETPYYAMEYVEGETLAQVLGRIREAPPDSETPFGRKNGAAYFETLARAFAEVAEGLQHAHAKKVIHRDIKPSNLILDRGPGEGGSGQGRLRILDFGLARLEGQKSLTLSGDLLGTPAYMSPEQARRRKIPIDHRTDVYSLGATMYETVAGRPPFRGKDHQDTLSQIIERDPVEPRKLNARVAADLETIILKCLRKDAGDRYLTAEALAQDLRRCASGDPIEARPQAGWEKLLRRAWRLRFRIAAGLGAALLALTAALLASAYHGHALEAKEARYRELVLRAVGSLEVGGLGEPLVHQNAQRLSASALPYLVNEAFAAGDPARGRARSALEELEEAVRLFPRRPEARYHLARALWRLGRRKEAIAATGEALRFSPSFGALRSLRAAILVQEGEPELAREEREEARRLGGAAWTEPWFRAREAAAAGDWPAAAEAFGELLAREKEGELFIAAALELRLGRGLAYLRGEEPEKARIEFTRAHDRWPEALAPAYLIGRSFVQEGKRKLAAAWFREYQRFTSRADGEVFRFLLDLMEKDYETLALWAEAMSPSPARDRLLAGIHVEGGRLHEALEVARRSVEERPDNALDVAHLAYLNCFRAGGGQEAEELIAQAYAKDPGNPAVCAFAVVVSRLLGKLAAKEKWCRRLLQLDPDSGWGLMELADALQAQGRADEAVRVIEVALDKHPFSPRSRGILGFIHLRRRHFDPAEQESRRALELDSEDLLAIDNLGMIAHGRGHLEEAERLHRRALELWPFEERTAAALVPVLEEAGRLTEALPFVLLVLKATNKHWDPWTQNVHRCLQDALRTGPGLGIGPELDELADALEAFVAGGEKPPHLLESLALLLLHAPGGRDPERALALAREAMAVRPPSHPGGRATLAAVHAARREPVEAIRALEGASGLDGELGRQLARLREAHLPRLASPASADWALEQARREVLVAEGARWRYLVAAPEAAPLGWTAPSFRDEAWNEGPSGFGYGGGDDATVLEPRRSDAVHIRHRFVVEEPHRYRRLLLSLRVDGAYAAWLNGREVARGVADAGRWMRRKPHVFIEHALDPRLLQKGENLLALSARDAALWGRGLSLIPALTADGGRNREAELELRERFAVVAQAEDERRTLAYLDARILEEDGTAEEAPRLFAALAAAERTFAEPHLRHAGHVLARGDAGAAEEHLRRLLAEGFDHPALWNLWARTAFRDLGWSADEVLARLPVLESAWGADLRWLLETFHSAGAARINCGGEDQGTAEIAEAGGPLERNALSSVSWSADRFFTSGVRERSDNNYARVQGTVEQPLFQVARIFPPAAAGLPGYRLPVPRGRYRVTLHFAEINFDFQGPGRRVFDIVIEGKTAREGYDPVARVGFATAETVSFEPVLVDDGRLEIEFIHRVRDPLVSAIEVERVD